MKHWDRKVRRSKTNVLTTLSRNQPNQLRVISVGFFGVHLECKLQPYANAWRYSVHRSLITSSGDSDTVFSEVLKRRRILANKTVVYVASKRRLWKNLEVAHFRSALRSTMSTRVNFTHADLVAKTITCDTTAVCSSHENIVSSAPIWPSHGDDCRSFKTLQHRHSVIRNLISRICIFTDRISWKNNADSPSIRLSVCLSVCFHTIFKID